MDQPNPVEILRRWVQSGGRWRVVVGSSATTTVALCRCDGGEEVDRIVSNDPRLLAFLEDADAQNSPD